MLVDCWYPAPTNLYYIAWDLHVCMFWVKLNSCRLTGVQGIPASYLDTQVSATTTRLSLCHTEHTHMVACMYKTVDMSCVASGRYCIQACTAGQVMQRYNTCRVNHTYNMWECEWVLLILVQVRIIIIEIWKLIVKILNCGTGSLHDTREVENLMLCVAQSPNNI